MSLVCSSSRGYLDHRDLYEKSRYEPWERCFLRSAKLIVKRSQNHLALILLLGKFEEFQKKTLLLHKWGRVLYSEVF